MPQPWFGLFLQLHVCFLGGNFKGLHKLDVTTYNFHMQDNGQISSPLVLSPTPLWPRLYNTWPLHSLKWKSTCEPPTCLPQNEHLNQLQVPSYLVNHLHLAPFPPCPHLAPHPLDLIDSHTCIYLCTKWPFNHIEMFITMDVMCNIFCTSTFISCAPILCVDKLLAKWIVMYMTFRNNHMEYVKLGIQRQENNFKFTCISRALM